MTDASNLEDFKSLNIHSNILKAVTDMGFKNPTEIQAKAIDLLTNTDKDFIGQAQTGTGKTAAFVIPLLQKIDYNNKNVQALILAPTRELANQVEKEIGKLGKYTDVRSICVYGGTSYDKQIHSLKREHPQIVVGTPGRVIDLINKGILKLDSASFCVLDEADEMLNMGFLEDVQIVLGIFPKKRQLIMFSATMPTPILRLIQKEFKEYEMVKIKRASLSNDDIEQQFFVVRDKHHREALARLISGHEEEVFAMVFCRTKIETKEVGDDLKKRGHSVEVLNGDMGQSERDHAMRRFKERQANIMVCTDVAARGIDVNNLTHVFNFGLPQDNESYVHRIGRTGRAGMKGKAYTIIGQKSAFAIKRIERHINSTIIKGKLPTIDVLKKKLIMKEVVGAQQIAQALNDKREEFKTDQSFEQFKDVFENLSKDEILKVMFTWKFNKVLRHYDNLADIETFSSSKSSSSSSSNRGLRRSSRTRRPRTSGENRRRSSSSGERRNNYLADDSYKSSGRRSRSEAAPRRTTQAHI